MIRNTTPTDFPTILALNAASEHFTSPLDAPRLADLHAMAAYHRVAADGAAFLLAFAEETAYDSPNYRWFAARHARFLYIDRVVVAADRRREGLGAALYRDLFEFARRSDFPVVTCEFYVEPPNETSRIFHARFGFQEVGTLDLDGGKRVSLQEAAVTPARPAP